ncbi:MAG: hypothetical protein HQ530_01250, partial [Parcubacteria group bacterium]|nr:hypothetical protein [Parcubacteria group bacterium]
EFDVEKEVSEEDWGKMRENYERYCQEGDWWEATCQAMNFKVLFPDKIAELNLESRWAQMKERYEQDCQGENWEYATYQAMNLKILAAKEVRITDQGLELVMPEQENFKQPTPPRPERKELN